MSAAGRKAPHILCGELSSDSAECMDEGGSGVAADDSLEVKHPVVLFAVRHQGCECFNEKESRFALDNEFGVCHEGTVKRAADIDLASSPAARQ